MRKTQVTLDLIFIQEISTILGIKTPSLEYVKDFLSIGRCIEEGFKVQLCENWEYTLRSGKLSRYVVLAHELVHAKQIQTGQKVEKYNGTIFKEKFISDAEYSKMDYDLVPWEAEANAMMFDLCDKAIASLQAKGVKIKKGVHKVKAKPVEVPKDPNYNPYDKFMKRLLQEWKSKTGSECHE